MAETGDFFLTKISRISFDLLTCKIVNDLTRNDQSDHGRNKRGGAGDVPALCAFSDGSGRADAVLSAADGHILQRPYRYFLGIDDFERFDSSFPALTAHHFGKRADGCLVNIRSRPVNQTHFCLSSQEESGHFVTS